MNHRHTIQVKRTGEHYCLECREAIFVIFDDGNSGRSNGNRNEKPKPADYAMAGILPPSTD